MPDTNPRRGMLAPLIIQRKSLMQCMGDSLSKPNSPFKNVLFAARARSLQ